MVAGIIIKIDYKHEAQISRMNHFTQQGDSLELEEIKGGSYDYVQIRENGLRVGWRKEWLRQ